MQNTYPYSICGFFRLAFLACAALTAAAAEPPVVPPSGHPRLLLRQDQLPASRASRDEPGLCAAWAELRHRAEFPADYDPLPRYDLAVLRAAEATAFLALVENNSGKSRRAIDLAFQLLSDGGAAKNLGYFGRLSVGHCLFAVAEVYDWCHAAMTPEERRRLCALMREHASVMELNAWAVERVAATGRWAAICTSNFAGPQFHGMLRDVAWHQRLNQIIKSAALPACGRPISPHE